MYWTSGYFFGMNLIWWFFWVAMVGIFFSLLTPVPRGRYRTLSQQTPLEMLRRRLASGEITPAEYEERRTLLLRDVPFGTDRVRTPEAPLTGGHRLPPAEPPSAAAH